MLYRAKIGKGIGLKIYNSFNLNELCGIKLSETQKDARFTLYDPFEKKTEVVMVDIDGIGRSHDKVTFDAVEDAFGDVKIYQVYTGGGFHFYIPLKESFDDDLFKNYRRDYTEACKEIQKNIPMGNVDTQVFSRMKYGRIPGSINHKRNLRVEYIQENDCAPARSIDQLLRYEAIRDTKSLANRSEGPGVVIDNCPMLQYVKKHQRKVSYKLWTTCVFILGKAGDLNGAHAISEKHPEYDAEEVDNLCSKADEYNYTCRSIAVHHREETKNACDGCPHNIRGSSPSFISGPKPTPSAKHGFHPQDKDGGINEARIDAVSVINHWVNTYRDDYVMTEGGKLYRYENPFWREVKIAKGVFPKEVQDEIVSIPHGGIATIRDMNDVMNAWKRYNEIDVVKAMNDVEPYEIHFKNGILNTATGEMRKVEKEDLLTNEADYIYDKMQGCDAWLKFLSVNMGRTEQKLLQVFFGLALSNIPNGEYQKYLWIYGEPGSGKSTIASVLSRLLAERSLTMGGIPKRLLEGICEVDYREKGAIVFDDVKMDYRKSTIMAWESVANALVSTVGPPIRELYQPLVTNARPTCTMFVFSNNEPPATAVNSGTTRRMRRIHMYRDLGEENWSLIPKLNDEIEGIFAWAVRGLEKYLKWGVPEMAGNEKFIVTELRDTVFDDDFHTFVKMRVVKDAESVITMKALHTHFISKMKLSAENFTYKRFCSRMRLAIPKLLHIPLHRCLVRRSQGMVWAGIRVLEGVVEDE